MKINNPILKGFNPDPSILRVDDDYYIATSTFEWFPGVQIHHSRDLVHWQVICQPLNRMSQLDLRGDVSSAGVWAPCLSYNNDLFYLIYTDMKNWNGSHGYFRDQHNYLVTSPTIKGPWSDPIFLNSSGFDPSLFHDKNGKKYLVNMLWDHRFRRNPFSGIVLQEYSVEEKRLIGPITNIFKGTNLGLVEGPHLYQHNGYYYLMTAEGGTKFEHATTLARSKDLLGPYEVQPDNPILTSWDDHTLVLQKAGHSSLVETQNGEWYLVHLCGRPLPNRGVCILGRETAIQKVEWDNEGWLHLSGGGHSPKVEVTAPNLPSYPFPEVPKRDDFDSENLSLVFQTLRKPLETDQMTLKERPGYLRLKGAESLASHFNQSLIARRQQAFCYVATTVVEFDPESFQQMAGLIAIYNDCNYYYLYLSWDEENGKVLQILANKNGTLSEPMKGEMIKIPNGQCYLRIEVKYQLLQFFYSTTKDKWRKIGPSLDTTILSDEYGNPNGFTGAFVGLCCQDLSGKSKQADFDYFEYFE